MQQRRIFPLKYLASLLILVGSGPFGPQGLNLAFGATRIFGPGDGLPSNLIYSLCQDRQGLVWFGTSAGLAYSDGVTFARADGAPQDQIWSILEDKAGALWVGTSDGRIARRTNGIWCEFGPADGLPPNKITRLFEDSHGKLWTGSNGAGLFYLVGTGCPTPSHFERDPQI